MFSLIIPVYKNEENIPPLLQALEKLGAQLADGFEVVCVVDGSPDASFELLSRGLPRLPFRSQLLQLSRNFGSFSAIRAGLEAATGERFAAMAADLQEPPELILEFDRLLRSGDHDVVFGQRTSRRDPLFGRLGSSVYWSLYRRLVQKGIPPGGVDIFGCNSEVRQELLRLNERNSSLLGLLFWIGFRRAFVPYERRARAIGRSAWTLSKKARYLMDSVFGFTDLPIRILIRVGALALLASLVFGAIVMHRRFVNLIPVPGYAATVLVVTFFGALNCFGLGIIGSYVWRTFENTKSRPDHILSRHQKFEGKSPTP
jgi:glycosyltransferase involved in cell wall biosynthesis